MECDCVSDRGGVVCDAGALELKATETGLAGRARRVLASRRWPFLLAALAIVVSLPTVRTGLMTDDYMHRAMLLGDAESARQLADMGLMPKGSGRLGPVLSDLFVAVEPNENLERFQAYGTLPWWTDDGYRVAFWRPLASLTHWLDYRLFPNSIGLMHLHNILWFAAVVFVAALLYRRLIDATWIAGLAGLLYLLNDDSYFPTMWLANRNLLISLVFGLVALILHDRWRTDHWKGGAVLAPLCFLACLLATEGGIAIFAYLFAYEAVLASGARARRFGALVPYVAVILAWRLVYSLQGYGASGGGYYVDPVRHPAAFLVAAVKRLPFLLGGQWTTSPPELHSFLPPAGGVLLWCLLALVVVLIPLGLWPLWRANRRMRFWLAGMYGAALPVCATVPMSRALLFVAVGAFGLIAECLGAWWRRADEVCRADRSHRLLRLLIVGLFVTHLPWAVVTRACAAKVTSKAQKRLSRTLAIGLYLRLLPDQDLVIVNAPNPASFAYDPFWAAHHGKALPAGIRTLAPGYGPVEIVRTGPRRLVIRSIAESLFDCQEGHRPDPVFFYRDLSDVRGTGRPFKAGARITLPRLVIDVLTVDDRGLPTEVAFEFEAVLEARTLRWLWWNWNRRHFVVFRPPPVGHGVCLPGPF